MGYTKICPVCSIEFKNEQKAGKCCSRKCGYAYNVKHVAIPCKNCNTLFKPSCAENIYCSRKCCRDAKSVRMICSYCNGEFQRTLSNFNRSGSSYCSNKCRLKTLDVKNKTVYNDAIIFHNIANYPKHEVSKCGVVRNKSTKHIKKYSINHKGYYQVRLPNENNKWSTERVHRIVAINFIPNPLNLPQVNHKDGNKLNNNVSNLEWADNSRNQKHAYEFGLNKGSKKRTIEMEKNINELHLKSISGRKIAKLLNIGHGIVQVYLRKYKNT